MHCNYVLFPELFKFSAMDEYTHGFEALKGMRTLRWKPHLGLVELDVELADRTLSLSVTPAQATAIMHFQDKGIIIPRT